ncbi:MAG: hypothetical protein KBT03_13705 [Bacteroidales bacterium]|nr:hypothetical protein [Candidatus Scybalousia scybalohippi]
MGYKEILNEYVESGNEIEMIHLADMTNDFVCEVKKSHPELAHDFVMKLKLYKHPMHDRETVEHIVAEFQNDDGTNGQHWDYDTTSKIAESYGIDKNVFYYVINMMYSDFYYPDKSDDRYIKDAVKFIHDKDAPVDKAERYYRAMHY